MSVIFLKAREAFSIGFKPTRNRLGINVLNKNASSYYPSEFDYVKKYCEKY
jgi:hypothetical protein